MNIEMQSCGLLMMIILLVVIIREKSLDLGRRKKYFDTMLACTVCLAMDILSVIGITYASRGMIPSLVAFAVCKLYLVFLINVGYRGLIYTAGEFLKEKAYRKLRNIYRVIFIPGVILILVLPINYFCQGRVVYSYGPSTISTYSMAVILLVSTVLITLIKGKDTSKRRKRVIILWQVCWIVAAFIQFMRPELLVVSFAASFGIVLVYAELENPNEGIDRLTGQFNSSALHTYLNDRYSRGIPFSAMHVSIDYGAGEFDLELEQKAMRQIADFLDNDRKSYIFKESDRDFVAIYNDQNKMQSEYERASAEMKDSVGLPINVNYTLLPDSSIFENGDEFMQFQHYNVKNINSSDCTVAGKELAEEMRDYLRIRDQISWAIANDGVEVYYQPIYDVENDEFNTAEALMRIHDSEGNIVMPGRFIPIAEENGLIIPLGIEVFKQVCRFLSGGTLQKLGIRYIEVNLSMAQFNEKDPASFVQRIMDEYHIDPSWINLEITETADPITRQVVLKNMQTLIDRGVHFSLDDFGTGRSNFDYFVAMPISIVKFDYSMTHWYCDSAKARDVIESIVGMLNRMDLPIVMEGVETKEELDTMIGLGAAYIQGFYFSKPLPEEEFISFLKERQS